MLLMTNEVGTGILGITGGVFLLSSLSEALVIQKFLRTGSSFFSIYLKSFGANLLSVVLGIAVLGSLGMYINTDIFGAFYKWFPASIRVPFWVFNVALMYVILTSLADYLMLRNFLEKKIKKGFNAMKVAFMMNLVSTALVLCIWLLVWQLS